jgi:hypothetical protein
METLLPADVPPKLWNPNAAANWSLVFTPAFGALLHAKNADSLGRIEEARANRVWVYVTVAYLAVTLVSIFIPAIPDGAFRVAGLVLLLSWYFSLAKKQARYVKESLHSQYERRSWIKPLLGALGSLLGFFALAVVLSAIQIAMSGSA